MAWTVSEAERARWRSCFPALDQGVVFLENAGGSPAPRQVIEAMARHMRERYVQLGAGHPLSRQATAMVEQAHAFTERLVNGPGGRVILGPSSSALLAMLARCLGEARPRRVAVVAETGHEANVGPWKQLARGDWELRWWRLDPASWTCPLQELESLLDEEVEVVALPQVSNLLGRVEDLRAVSRLAHRAGAQVVADGVAFAPHRAVDVAAWEVDWYVFSTYKVYGPHMAALWGREDRLAGLRGPNHFFVPDDEVPYKFELGGVSHEACAAWLGLGEYLKVVADAPEAATVDRALIERAFARMEAAEAPLTRRLVQWLDEHPRVRVIGPVEEGVDRVGTVSFVHESLSSAEVAAKVDRTEVALRHGHMYAWHLCQALGLEPEDGVVRVSLVHLNSPEEIERLLEILDSIL